MQQAVAIIVIKLLFIVFVIIVLFCHCKFTLFLAFCKIPGPGYLASDE